MDTYFANCRGVTNDGRPQCKSKRIVAVQGPFSYDMNRIMFHDTKASVVVMKNSGLVGGADTKLQAAMDLGIHVIVIDRPRVKLECPVVSSNDEFLNYGRTLMDYVKILKLLKIKAWKSFTTM